MSCFLEYDSTLSRVRVDADTLCVSGSATYATVERSTDGSTYTTIRGGESVLVTGCGMVLPADDYEFTAGIELTYRVTSYNDGGTARAQYTCTITVEQDQTWLKSVERPFLNRPINCVQNPHPLRRRQRNGVFNVMGRSYPVSTTDVRSGYEFELRFVSSTYSEQLLLDYLFASGDVLYLQPVASFPIGAMFLEADTITANRPVLNRTCDADYRAYVLSVSQVATPDASIVGTTVTWRTVILAYATWADVIADNASWADLMDLVADPSEVIVP